MPTIETAKRKRKTRRHQILVKLRPELVEALREVAAARSVTVTAIHILGLNLAPVR